MCRGQLQLCDILRGEYAPTIFFTVSPDPRTSYALTVDTSATPTDPLYSNPIAIDSLEAIERLIGIYCSAPLTPYSTPCATYSSDTRTDSWLCSLIMHTQSQYSLPFVSIDAVDTDPTTIGTLPGDPIPSNTFTND